MAIRSGDEREVRLSLPVSSGGSGQRFAAQASGRGRGSRGQSSGPLSGLGALRVRENQGCGERLRHTLASEGVEALWCDHEPDLVTFGDASGVVREHGYGHTDAAGVDVGTSERAEEVKRFEDASETVRAGVLVVLEDADALSHDEHFDLVTVGEVGLAEIQSEGADLDPGSSTAAADVAGAERLAA